MGPSEPVSESYRCEDGWEGVGLDAAAGGWLLARLFNLQIEGHVLERRPKLGAGDKICSSAMAS
ncbi:MAG: hypothetical protein QW756_06350 [Nitrososphaerota archaeon]